MSCHTQKDFEEIKLQKKYGFDSILINTISISFNHLKSILFHHSHGVSSYYFVKESYTTLWYFSSGVMTVSCPIYNDFIGYKGYLDRY